MGYFADKIKMDEKQDDQNKTPFYDVLAAICKTMDLPPPAYEVQKQFEVTLSIGQHFIEKGTSLTFQSARDSSANKLIKRIGEYIRGETGYLTAMGSVQKKSLKKWAGAHLGGRVRRESKVGR